MKPENPIQDVWRARADLLAEHGGDFNGVGVWWPIFPLLWFGLIVGAIAFFGSRFRRGMHQRPYLSGESVLAERYARGEIDADEYGDRLRTLRERSR